MVMGSSRRLTIETLVKTTISYTIGFAKVCGSGHAVSTGVCQLVCLLVCDRAKKGILDTWKAE